MHSQRQGRPTDRSARSYGYLRTSECSFRERGVLRRHFHPARDGLAGPQRLARPLLDHPVSDGQQRRPEEDPDETERQRAADDAEENQNEWGSVAPTDDPGLDDVIDAADGKAPRQHED